MTTPPGSLASLREANLQRLLDALSGEAEISQAELTRATGLSAAAVSSLTVQLAARGQVEVRQGTTNGRRGNLVRKTLGGARIGAGIDLGRTHIRTVIGTESGRIAEHFTAIAHDLPRTDVLRLLRETLETASSAAGVGLPELDVVTASIVAPVSPATGEVVAGPAGAFWADLDIERTLSDAVGREVAVENDANLGALALSGLLGSVGGIVYVKMASGVGAGFVIADRLIRGKSGSFGEFGHLTIDPGLAMTCSCGRRGCLETLCSTESIRAGIARAVGGEIDVAETLELVASREPAALDVVRAAGDAMGRGLGWLGMTVNPARIYLDGPFVYASETLLDAVRDSFERTTWPIVSSTTVVDSSPLGEHTIAMGALIAGLDRTVQPRNTRG